MNSHPIDPFVAAAMPLVAMFANVVAVFVLVAWRFDILWLFVFAAVWIIAGPLWLWVTSKQALPFWSGFCCWLLTLTFMVAGFAGNIAIFVSIAAAA